MTWNIVAMILVLMIVAALLAGAILSSYMDGKIKIAKINKCATIGDVRHHAGIINNDE